MKKDSSNFADHQVLSSLFVPGFQYSCYIYSNQLPTVLYYFFSNLFLLKCLVFGNNFFLFLNFYFQCFGNISTQTLARQVCELGLIIGMIIGRWLLPRGEITRDQLSALLLGYVGTAADTLELFEVLDEQAVSTDQQVTHAVLGVYTWSLLQFCLVTTATTGKNNQIRITNNKVGIILLLALVKSKCGVANSESKK